MAVEQKISGVLQSAGLVFELAIIEPSRYGPIIHANVPDYAEILLKVFIEEAGRNTTKAGTRDKGLNFYELKQDIVSNPGGIDVARFQVIADYFLSIREEFRNPLHHTDKVQGYVIAKSVALECLLTFDELLWVLFPALTPLVFSNMNYPGYVQYIRLDYVQAFGKNIRLYKAVNAALRRIEEENNFNCPDDFDSSRVNAIRQLFRYEPDTFTRVVLNYRPHIRQLIVDELYTSSTALSSNQLLPRLRGLPNNQDLTIEEIERCLGFMEGVRFDGYGIVTSARSRTVTGNSIIRYSFIP